MGTDLAGGAVLTTPSVRVTEELAGDLVVRGGYTHPLFHPDDAGERPLPGQAVLLLMGGLVEQSGALDHAVALLEIRRARFSAMVLPGSDLRVEVALGARTPTSSPGRARQEVTWTALDQAGAIVATAEVLMLVNHSEEDDR